MGFWEQLAYWIRGDGRREAAAVAAAPVTADSAGWSVVGTAIGANDRDWAEMQGAYTDALEAWRKHPQARRIIDITTDHVLGDGLRPSASGVMGRFIDQFWTHRQNRMDMRLPALVDELSRAGDLFIVLFRNPADGMSYVRVVPKPNILKIVTAENDWEQELEYHERRGPGEEPRVWLSPAHPGADAADAVMMHYVVNRPVGALFGDGDLAPIIPWLLRYSKMLEDRVRLNWAARMFHWFVKVPKSAVAATRAKYQASTPQPGAIIVHDESEEWDFKAPNLAVTPAQNDLQALRMMIAVGAGQPPHWHGDSMDVNLATATAMERTAVRHLSRRQREVADMVIDLCYTAYLRAYRLGMARRAPSREAIAVDLPDLSRDDNTMLASAAGQLATAFNGLAQAMGTPSAALRERTLRLFFQFMGEPMTDREAQAILDEIEEAKANAPTPPVAPVEDAPEEEGAVDSALAWGWPGVNGHGR